MQLNLKREFNVNGERGRVYETDNSITVERIIELAREFESDRAKFFACYCDTFTESGTPWSPELDSINNLSQMNKFPNPSINLRIAYTNRQTDEYEFDISTAINSNTITHEYDPSMKEYIRKQVELRKMIESKRQEMKSVSNIKKLND